MVGGGDSSGAENTDTGDTSGNDTSTPVQTAKSSQAILGPLSGASIQAFQLSDLNNPIETTTAEESTTDLDIAGSFDLQLNGIPDDEMILVSVTGGNDIDADDDGVVDASPTANSGTINALATAADWRSGGKVNVLTELVWREVKAKVEAGDITDLADMLQWAASGILAEDLNGDGVINYKDLIDFVPSDSVHRQKMVNDYSQFTQVDEQGNSLLDYIHNNDLSGFSTRIQALYGNTLELPSVPELISVQATVTMPSNRKSIVSSDAVVSSFVSDVVEIQDTNSPTLLMAEDNQGRTLLLGYSMPDTVAQSTVTKVGFKAAAQLQKVSTASNTDISTRSTALALVMLSIGGGVDGEDRAALSALVLAHTDFDALAQAIDEAFQADPYFLDSIMNDAVLLQKVKALGTAVLNQYLADIEASQQQELTNNKSTVLSSYKPVAANGPKNFWFASPWNNNEPWNWYGDTNLVDVLDPPFLAVAVNDETTFALGNPTNINYAAEFYSDQGEYLGWRLTRRNSTIIQKSINSGAAQTKLFFGKDISERVGYVEFHKYFMEADNNQRRYILLVLHLFHALTGIANVAADGSFLQSMTDLFVVNTDAQVVLGNCGVDLLSSIDFSTDIADFIRGNWTSIIETSVTSCLIPAANVVMKNSSSKIEKIVGKTAAKMAIKITNPLGWASIVFAAGNDLAPFGVSLIFADPVVGYDLEWDNKTLVSVNRTDAHPVANANEARIIKPNVEFTPTQETGLNVSFDARSSTFDTANGASPTYTWDFGDGQTGTGETISHPYTTAGDKKVTLTLDDQAY